MTWFRCQCRTSGTNLNPGDPDAWQGAIHTPNGDVIGTHHTNTPCETGDSGGADEVPVRHVSEWTVDKDGDMFRLDASGTSHLLVVDEVGDLPGALPGFRVRITVEVLP